MKTELESRGWKHYPESGGFPEYYGKAYPDAPPCNLNKHGVVLVINVSRWGEHVGYEIELRAEKPDGVWCRLVAYGVEEEKFLAALDPQISQLLTAWKALNP